MEVIKISGHGYSESVLVVEAKETEKSFMVDGLRFTKSTNSKGSIAEKRGYGDWDSGASLYAMDNEFALSKLDNKRHINLCHEINRRLQKRITKEQAKAIADILGL